MEAQTQDDAEHAVSAPLTVSEWERGLKCLLSFLVDSGHPQRQDPKDTVETQGFALGFLPQSQSTY